jgi:hypothetical protein
MGMFLRSFLSFFWADAENLPIVVKSSNWNQKNNNAEQDKGKSMGV